MMMIAPHHGSLGLSLGTKPWSPSPAVAVDVPPSPTGDEEADSVEFDDAFARLARLVVSNDRLLAKLKSLDAKLVRANAFADDPASNQTLARANRDRVRDCRSGVLLLLRANRIAAREFLGS